MASTRPRPVIVFEVKSAQAMFQRIVAAAKSSSTINGAMDIFVRYLQAAVARQPKMVSWDPDEYSADMWRAVEPRLATVVDPNERTDVFYKILFDLFNISGKLVHTVGITFWLRYDAQVPALLDLMLKRDIGRRSTPLPSSSSVSSSEVTIVRSTPAPSAAAATRPTTVVPQRQQQQPPSRTTTQMNTAASDAAAAAALGEADKRKLREILQRLESLQTQYDTWYRQTETRIVQDRATLIKVVDEGRAKLVRASERATQRINASLIKK